MSRDELLEVIKVQETHSQSEANTLLSQGWKLINVYTALFSSEVNDQANIYVLGKFNDR
jgi:hypothetical protein